MPSEEGVGRQSAAKRLLQALRASQMGDALSQYARRCGVEAGKHCRPEWEKDVRLLLLVRGRLPDQRWIRELVRLRKRWSDSAKARVKGLAEFLLRDDVSPWLEPRSIRIWIGEQQEEALEPSPHFRDPRSLGPKQEEMEKIHDESGIVARIQAAFLSGLLEGILTRDVAELTRPRAEETS